MHRICFFAFVFILLTSSGCLNSQRDNSSFITGSFEGHTGTIRLVELDIHELRMIDSTTCREDGSFSFQFSNDSLNIFALQFDKDDIITLILDKTDTVIVHIDLNEKPYHVSVDNSRESMLMGVYEQYTNHNLHKVDSLRAIFERSKGDPGFFAISSLIDQAYQEILIDQKIFSRNFIQHNPGSLAALVVLNRNFKQFQLFDQFEDFNYYDLLDSSLMLAYPGNKHVLKHHEITGKIRKKILNDKLASEKLSIGQPAPDMNLPGADANEYRLSDFHGKMLVLYFWAARDGRSRQVNQDLNALSKAYKDQYLEVYAFSLDTQEEIWKAAIRLDQLDWIHVSDLKSNQSPVIQLYQVPDKLPYFYLLNRKGIIIFRGHSFDEMKEVLIISLGETS
ncbi:MAG: redoxin domain-containing protein [Bacteroidota bacterium]|nr:redoxin domain-containing protein [Bacteroidota bacterium]